jgi:hypothetical protein
VDAHDRAQGPVSATEPAVAPPKFTERGLLGDERLDELAAVTLSLLMELAALSERVQALEVASGVKPGDMQARLDALTQRVLAALARSR